MLLPAFSCKVGPRPPYFFQGGPFEIKGGGGGAFFCPSINASANFAFLKVMRDRYKAGIRQKDVHGKEPS